MPGMYKDAKAWLKDSIESGCMEAKDLLGFLMGYVTNDDIETYWNISMDDADTNPGADRGECSECGSEADLEYLQAHDGLCETCVDDQAEAAKEKRRATIVSLIYSMYGLYVKGLLGDYNGLNEAIESLEDDLADL